MNEPGPQHERERQPELRPRIWIGSLPEYNAGRLHGDWVDAAVGHDELQQSVQRILASSREPGAEEWGIFDYDGFGAFRVHEHDQLEVVARVARGIVQHGPAFAVWAELHDGDEAMLEQFQDAFLGEYESPEAWAREVMDEINLDLFINNAVPEVIRSYITVDYSGWARDVQLNGEVHIEEAPGGRVYVFNVR